LKLNILSGVDTANTTTPLVLMGSDRTDYYASINSVRGAFSTVLGMSFSTTSGGAITERMLIAPAGDVTVSTGNVVIGTAGKGIDFSASTHAAGMTSELLNDYEEGTWTPTRNAFVEVVGAGAITTTGVYTKIGRMVHAQAIIVATGGATIAATSGAGSYLGGLPFTPASITSGTWVNGSSISTSGGTAIYTDGNVYIATSWVAAGGQWNFSITYTV